MLSQTLRPRVVRCTECGVVARGVPDGWVAHVVGGYDDEPVEVVVFCPSCAVREGVERAAA